MELDAAIIMQGLGLAGIIAILGWAWKINARVTGIESDVRHGFSSGRKNMKRHSEKIDTHDNEIRALEIEAAVARGAGGGGNPSNPSLRPQP